MFTVCCYRYRFSSGSSSHEDYANWRLKVVPSEDSHQSEYIAPCDGRRG